MLKQNIVFLERNEIMVEGLKLKFDEAGFINSKFINSYSELFEIIQQSENEVDQIIIDTANCKLEEIALIKQSRIKYNRTKLILIIWEQNRNKLTEITKFDPDGIIYRLIQFEELMNAISIIKNGGTYFSLSILNDILDEDGPANNSLALLSSREFEILKLISKGLTSKEIAEKLYLSHFTVENHRKNMMRKMDVKNSVELVQIAASSGLINE